MGNGLTQNAGVAAAPLSFTAPSGAACTYSRIGNWNLDNNGSHWAGGSANSRRLNPGVYCATGTISMTLDNVSGNVTFSAGGRIDLIGDLTTLRAYHPSGVLLYAGSNTVDAIDIAGTYNMMSGHLYAPAGRIDIRSTDFTLNGAIIGHRVRLLGDRISVITATP
jgi:hypothetical protein